MAGRKYHGPDIVAKRLKVTGIVGEHKPLPKGRSRYSAVIGSGALGTGSRVPTPTKAEVDEVARQAREFRTSAGRKRTVTRGEAKWAAESNLYQQAHDRDEAFRQRMRRSNRGPYRISKRQVTPSAVGKRLVDEQKHTSMVRLLGATAGMSAIAYGGSRSRVLGHGLRMGAANEGLDPGVRRALTAAERSRRMIEQSTRPLGAGAGYGIGKLPKTVREALEGVPKPLRPATASLAGAILLNHSRPVTRKTYHPVVMVDSGRTNG